LGLWTLFWLIIPLFVWVFLVFRKMFALLHEFEGSNQ
jgi:hypothetical protein